MAEILNLLSNAQWVGFIFCCIGAGMALAAMGIRELSLFAVGVCLVVVGAFLLGAG